MNGSKLLAANSDGGEIGIRLVVTMKIKRPESLEQIQAFRLEPVGQ
jgi:hypothetical protein